MERIQNACRYLHRHGVKKFLAHVLERSVNHCCERYFGVDTSEYIDPGKLGYGCGSELIGYEAAGYRILFRLLRRTGIRYEASSFLDYGCGKGRGIVAAAAFPFGRVIGIELSAPLVALARKNLASMRHRRARQVLLNHADATGHAVDDDVNVIYFYNPFYGDVLRAVLDNIHASLMRAPRDIHILFVNSVYFEPMLSDFPWIKKIYGCTFRSLPCGIFRAARPDS